jgi:hypothetical protein|tara:strand:- start:481 stop:849 length:369 start_codon:yes stop_codon:yes gene_type:complete
MKLFDDLDNKNFELYAAKYYDNPSCLSVEDFHEDLARFKYIIRLLRRYRETGIVQERLILNHIISIYNVFDIKAATRMMFYRIDDELWSTLKTFLIYLNYLPTSQYKNITVDINIANKLKNI